MKTLSSEELGEAVFAMLKEQPFILAKNAQITHDMLLHEQAAQSMLLDLMERRIENLDDAPDAVRGLIAAFMSQFLHDLAIGPLQNEKWEAPSEAPPADQARYVIAALLREKTSLWRSPQ